VDPLRSITGQSFAFTNDDPVNLSDPSGLCGQLGPGLAGPYIPCNQYLKTVDAQDGQLKNLINQLYRPGAKVGDGGTADMLREEADAPSWNGDVTELGHWTKVNDRINELNNLLKGDRLCEGDQAIAENLLEDLQSAKQSAFVASDALALGLPPDASMAEVESAAEASDSVAGDAGDVEGPLSEFEGWLGDLGEL
jgi:hypothetical protein